MPRTLSVADGSSRILSPTTTVRLAERMLAASWLTREILPDGFYSTTALDLLMAMYVAEEGGSLLQIDDVRNVADRHPRVTKRWLDALKTEGLVDVVDHHPTLTAEGLETVERLLEKMFDVQRGLDSVNE